jgi:hypothetical protein
MGLRRFRNAQRAIGAPAARAATAQRKNNSALIFGVFARRTDCRLMAFRAL